MTVDESEIDSFVGKNASYYSSKWQRFRDQSGSVFSLNLAAVIFGPFWLLYRKLYVPLAWVIVVILIDVSLVLYVEANELLPPSMIMAWDVTAVLIYVVVVGLLGNYWYWNKFKRDNTREWVF